MVLVLILGSEQYWDPTHHVIFGSGSTSYNVFILDAVVLGKGIDFLPLALGLFVFAHHGQQHVTGGGPG